MATPKPPDPAGFERHLKGVATGEGKWTATSNGNRPRNAVHYGYEKDGDPLYVCRASINNGIHTASGSRAVNAPSAWGSGEVFLPV